MTVRLKGLTWDHPRGYRVLDALGGATTKLREELGESLATVQKFDVPLMQATTSSLEALQAYSLGAQQQQYSAAVPFYHRAIQLDPNFAWAYNGRGWAYCEMKDHDKAISDFNGAIRLDPKFARTYYNRGITYQSQGKLDEARADFAKADELEKAGQ